MNSANTTDYIGILCRLRAAETIISTLISDVEEIVRNEPVKKKLSEMTKEEKRKYYRRYRALNQDKIHAAQARFWEHKAGEVI